MHRSLCPSVMLNKNKTKVVKASREGSQEEVSQVVKPSYKRKLLIPDDSPSSTESTRKSARQEQKATSSQAGLNALFPLQEEDGGESDDEFMVGESPIAPRPESPTQMDDQADSIWSSDSEVDEVDATQNQAAKYPTYSAANIEKDQDDVLNQSVTSDVVEVEGLDDWVEEVTFDPEDANHMPLEPQGMYDTLIQEGGKKSTRKSLEKCYVRNVFAMVSMYLYENMSTSGIQMRDISQYQYLESKLEELMKTFPTREYPKLKFFVDLPDRTWPKCFLDFIQELRADHEKALKWAAGQKKLRLYCDYDKRKCYIGNKIREVGKTVKGAVNMCCNAKWLLWVDKIPSGCTEESLFRAIRRSLMRTEANKKAHNAFKTAAVRGSAKVDISLKTRQEAAYADMTFDWYPDYWLVFALFGLPARKNCLTALNGGNEFLSSVDPLGHRSRPPAGDTQNSPLTNIAKKGAEARAKKELSRAGVRAANVAEKTGTAITAPTTSAAVTDTVIHKVYVMASEPRARDELERRKMVREERKEKIEYQDKMVKMLERTPLAEMTEQEIKLYNMLQAFVSEE